eukprot:CAMPEP_0198294904 /NCGR_PEP_ID=MMETSP1449-20131203/24709_1 /TAXON_ID=420275 /ORGANISM="Attheya septentrionalis, Strain CCMP2084" /LENGTH=371 /DNA_ID=CAMNT_0043995001 /DNA_START=310 /DNA_END=1423 /DNA_ORIENTATION=+
MAAAQLLWNTSTDTDTDADGTIITKPYIPRGRSKCAASFIPSSPAFFIRNHAIIAKKYVCDNGPAFFIPPRSHCLFLGSHAYNIDMVDTTPVVVPAATPTNLIPRSRHWINDEILNQEHIIQLGMDSSGATVSTQEEDASSRPSPTTVTTIHRNKAGTAIAVEVASAITLNHVASIRALSNGIQEVVSTCSSPDNNGSSSRLCQHFEHRSFGDGQGGNDCTYLAPFIQALCPHVMMTVKDIATLAWKAASWDVDEHTHHPDPMSLGIRTSEYLSYEGWPSLEAHKDVGSIYTIMIAIKDPQEYDGGEFFIQNSMLDSTNVKLEKLSAIVFKSDTIHGVRTITSGHRESFVTELWLNNDSPIGVCRPTEDQW